MLFAGWGVSELPKSLDEVVDWMDEFGKDHGPIPEWVYALFDELLKFKDQCQIDHKKYRT